MKMIEPLSTTPAENDVSVLEKFLDLLGQAQTIWSILLFLAFVILFVLCLFLFRKNVNKYSKKQIDNFIKVKKYVPELYIELNENMEFLRYFIFSYRWKWRIIRRYNLLFKGYVGKQLKQAHKNNICYRLSYFSKFKAVKNQITNTNKVLTEFRDDRDNKREALGDFYFLAQSLSYDCINVTSELLSYCSKIENKNIIVVGSAGNGKTSLLCRATETAIKNKYPCLLLNSKDIDKNTVNFILDQLPLIWKVKNYSKWFLKLINFFLLVRRKYLFILIDAINENDSEEFLNSIGTVCDYFENYSRVKVIFSCRSEYFDCRYKKLFGEDEKNLDIFKLCTTDYNLRAVNKFFLKYSSYYKVPYKFSDNVHNKIRTSLFLMRIFFEVNSGRPYENLEFQNAEIYKQYIDKVASEHNDIDVNKIIRQISSKMIDSKCYDKVELSALNLSNTEKNALLNLLDNNLLINKTIQLGVGISERTTEFLYFIFDEFRDFCIARELIIRDEDGNDQDYSLLFNTINFMSKNALAPLEGILKYGYYHFKKIAKVELCKKILNSYGKSNIQQANFTHRYYRERTYYFDDFGLSLIYMDGKILQDYEHKYVYNSLRTSNRSNIQIFFFLLYNEIVNEEPNLCQYLDIVLNETDEQILSSLVDELVEEEKYFRNTPKLIDTFYKRINITYSNLSQIPENIKKILILIFSYEPLEWYQTKSGEPIEFDDLLYDAVISAIKCKELKKAVQELKDYRNSTVDSIDDIMDPISEIYGKK